MKEFYWRPTKREHPWAIFWGTFTRFSWGWDLRLPGFFITRAGGSVYMSRDGTPSTAFLWLRKRDA